MRGVGIPGYSQHEWLASVTTGSGCWEQPGRGPQARVRPAKVRSGDTLPGLSSARRARGCWWVAFEGETRGRSADDVLESGIQGVRGGAEESFAGIKGAAAAAKW
jgi:hypothetical protein